MSRFKKMVPAIKKLWVEALRSGKYRQAHGVMKDTYTNTPSYCCLGVLQELVEPENPLGRDGAAPTASCLKTAGLGRYRADEGGIVGKLMDLNDTENQDFKYIADFIEKNL